MSKAKKDLPPDPELEIVEAVELPTMPKLSREQVAAAKTAVASRFNEAQTRINSLYNEEYTHLLENKRKALEAINIVHNSRCVLPANLTCGITVETLPLNVQTIVDKARKFQKMKDDALEAENQRYEELVQKLKHEYTRRLKKIEEQAEKKYAAWATPLRAKYDAVVAEYSRIHMELINRRDRATAELNREREAALLAVQFNGDADIIQDFLAALPVSRKSLASIVERAGFNPKMLSQD